MILFISDLHLDASRPAVIAAFYQFLEERVLDAEALYILGDFFELWIGDDDDDPFVIDLQTKLAEITRKTPIFFMRGNRDFLVGDDFAVRTGVRLLQDPSLVRLGSTRALVMHGDSLCTKDEAYQTFRAQVRTSAWQKEVLSRSLSDRRALAAQLRAQSKTMSSSKPEDIMDVDDDAVMKALLEHQCEVLIHGHTHRPNHHAISYQGQSFDRYVLGDWHDNAWCLSYEKTLKLEAWPISS